MDIRPVANILLVDEIADTIRTKRITIRTRRIAIPTRRMIAMADIIILKLEKERDDRVKIINMLRKIQAQQWVGP